MHALVIWALMTGLARKAIEVIKKPLTATIIEEVKLPPPPPPPPKKIIEAPKVQPPVQTYVPPPDIPVPATTSAPVISAITATAPTEPHVIAPPPVVAPPPPPPKPAIRRGSQLVIVEKEDVTYPREAIRASIEKGMVMARLHIDEKGNVTDVEIMSAGSAAACSTARSSARCRCGSSRPKARSTSARSRSTSRSKDECPRRRGAVLPGGRSAVRPDRRTCRSAEPRANARPGLQSLRRRAIAAAAQVATPSATIPVRMLPSVTGRLASRRIAS